MIWRRGIDQARAFSCQPEACTRAEAGSPGCGAAPSWGPAAKRWGGEGSPALRTVAPRCLVLSEAPRAAGTGLSWRFFLGRFHPPIFLFTGSNTP